MGWSSLIGASELEVWRTHNYLVLPTLRGADPLTFVDGLMRSSIGRKHLEVDEKLRKARHSSIMPSENFVPYHKNYAELLMGETTLSAVSVLMGEPAVLYKEKINLKLPGGSGFRAHQDAPAFDTFGHGYHITAMVAIDDSTQTNGCLEVSDPLATGVLLPQTHDKSLSDEAIETLDWRPWRWGGEHRILIPTFRIGVLQYELFFVELCLPPIIEHVKAM